MDVQYPSLLGTSAPKSNAANLSTKGWELAATWQDRIGQDWQYSVTLALSDNKSEITKYDNPTGAMKNVNTMLASKLAKYGVMSRKVFSRLMMKWHNMPISRNLDPTGKLVISCTKI